jgi:transposase
MNPEKKKGWRRSYDEAFKRNAVALVENGERGVETVAAELGIMPWTLRKWRSLYGRSTRLPPGDLTDAEKDGEIARLRADIARLEEHEEILKKTLGIVIERPGGANGSKR